MKLPYWLWCLCTLGLHTHMKEHLSLWQLSDMAQAPDEQLDRKGLRVKRIAIQIMTDAYNGDY